MRFTTKGLVVLFCAALFFCCSVQKRQYRNGFYFSSIHKKDNAAKTVRLADKKTSALPADFPLTVNDLKPPVNLANVEKQLLYSGKISITTSAPPDTCGDIMTFRTGEEVAVKILEIDKQQIKYKKCNNLEGPLMITGTDKVFKIKYSNGTNEVFKQEVPAEVAAIKKTQPVERKNNQLALWSFICAIAAFLVIPIIPALVLGIIGLFQINRHPEKYKNKWMAIVGIIIGGIGTALILLTAFF